MKNKIAAILLVIGVISTFAANMVLAAPCAHSTNQTGQGGCLQQDWQDAQKSGFSGDYTAFQALIDKCQGTDSVNSSGFTKYLGTGYSTDTENGNCANAIVSCYKNAADSTACKDQNVLALIASCNEGDVGAGGNKSGGAPLISTIGKDNAGCGTDNALDDINELKGTKYQTNHGMADAWTDGVKDKECSGAGFTSQDDIKKCKDNVTRQLMQCAYDNGYLTKSSDGSQSTYNTDGSAGIPAGSYSLGKFDQTKLTNCMAGKATNEQQCKARAGPGATFTPNDPNNPGAGGKCAVPPPANQQQDCPPGDQSPKCVAGGPGGSVPGATTQCGQAKTNLITCDTKEPAANVLGDVLKFGVEALTVLVGVGAVAGIAWESINYARAQDDQGTVSKAKDRIRDIIIGLVVYVFMIAIINWLVPGGVIK